LLKSYGVHNETSLGGEVFDFAKGAMIRVPLGWSKINNLASKLNPQDETGLTESVDRQTIELRSPDGSAIIHLLLAGITLAAEWD